MDGRCCLIGVIHGNEAKGYEITQLIRTMPTPPGIDLWIIDSINPDGQAADTRENANGVDLNRNVSYNWNYIPKSGQRRPVLRRGARPTSPRRRRSSRSSTRSSRTITIFWHQDANRVSPGERGWRSP